MTKKIDYKDNIFFLNLVMKQLFSGLRLSLDTEFFLDKIYEDITFLDTTMGKILNSLKLNEQIPNRVEYLKDLERLNEQFIDFIENILAMHFPFSCNLEYLFQQLDIMKVNRQQDLTEIRGVIKLSLASAEESEHIVSEEEFKFLLSREEGEE